MKKLFSLLLLLLIINFQFLISNSVLAQKEANIWYFGSNAGLDFNGGAPVALTNSAMNTYEGCSSIADANGNLLFYTDGTTIWNRNHVPMPNGSGLTGNSTSTQAGMIVKQPGNANLYYVFTLYTDYAYSVVDMTLQGGNGDVQAGNKNIIISAGVNAEKQCATKNANGNDIWILMHEYGTNGFRAYLLTPAGLNLVPVVSNIGIIHNTGQYGQMKFNPQGTKVGLGIVSAAQGNVEVFDFSNTTGMVSNNIAIANGYSQCYGLEFSPDGTKMYATTNAGTYIVYQYDLNAGSAAAVIASQTQVGATQGFDATGMQLAPDNKIYVAPTGSGYLDVINNPNIAGVGCNYTNNGMFLAGRITNLGLPEFMSALFNSQPVTFRDTCFGDTTFFNIGDTTLYASVHWNFSDVASGIYNTSTQFNPFHIFTNTGNFLVKLVRTYINASMDSIIVPVHIIQCASIQANFQAVDSLICPGTCTDFTNFSVNATSYQWFFPGANPSVSTDANPSVICYNTSGSYDVTLIATNGTLVDTLVLPNYISVYPSPPPQGISQNGDTLFANAGAVSYQWYHGGILIPGATDYFYVADASGDFNVVATDANGCEVEAAIFDVVASVQSAGGNWQLAIYPNPVADKCTIRNSQFTMGTAAKIIVYNMIGMVAVQSDIRNAKSEVSIDVHVLPSGIYWLEVSSNGKTCRIKFVKQ